VGKAKGLPVWVMVKKPRGPMDTWPLALHGRYFAALQTCFQLFISSFPRWGAMKMIGVDVCSYRILDKYINEYIKVC